METNRTVLAIAALNAMANHIVTVPREQWDMEFYKKETACGTTGCALGHCAHLPEVQALFAPHRFVLEEYPLTDPIVKQYRPVIYTDKNELFPIKCILTDFAPYFDLSIDRFWELFGWHPNREVTQNELRQKLLTTIKELHAKLEKEKDNVN